MALSALDSVCFIEWLNQTCGWMMVLKKFPLLSE